MLDVVHADQKTRDLAPVVEHVDMSALGYQSARMAHWDQVARSIADGWNGSGAFYQKATRSLLFTYDLTRNASAGSRLWHGRPIGRIEPMFRRRRRFFKRDD